VVDTPALAVVDGGYGFGQTIAPLAVALGIEKAKTLGLSAISLRNSGHIGRVGEWGEMAAAESLISIHFVNAAGSVLVAPFGGIERRLSTAPFCVGIPRQGADPVVLDFATSFVAEGKVNVASRGGAALPEGALIGPDGAFSTDPATLYGPLTPLGLRNAALGEGAIRAFGGHKGSGLGLMCELLGGSLTGNGATGLGRRFANGMFSLYVDPARVAPVPHFRRRRHALSRLVQTGQTHTRSDDPHAGRARARIAGETSSRGRAADLGDLGNHRRRALSVGLDEARAQRAIAKDKVEPHSGDRTRSG